MPNVVAAPLPIVPDAPATSAPLYDAAIKKYAEVQGNILKGHGRDHAAFLFVEFGAAPAPVRKWLRQILDGKGPFLITPTKKQLEDARRFKEFSIPGNLFAMLLFTASGLRALGQELPHEPTQAPLPADQTGLAPSPLAFARGMRNAETSSWLQDPHPHEHEWDKGWFEPAAAGAEAPREAPATALPLHALLLLADDDLANLQRTVRTASDQLAAAGIALRIVEWGHALRNADGNGIEHFGYADGVSQPIYLPDDLPTQDADETKGNAPVEGTDRWNPSADPEKLVLVPDPAGSFGSFFVFRKLRQHVRDFKEAEERLAQRIGLAKGDEERAGAMLVGRFEDGTPLVERSTDGLINPIINNFNFEVDPDGLKCPFHAHIRKMNPRGETAGSGPPATPQQQERARHEERLRTLTRRGIPFGSPEEAQKEDGKPVGLLFMCFQRNIGQQFEFIQKFWANNAKFLSGQNPGLDPIIGQGTRKKLNFNYTYGAAGTRPAAFEAFVELCGGEYFYAPSMRGLAALAGAAGA